MPPFDQSLTSARTPLAQPRAPSRVVVAENDDILRELLVTKLRDDGYEAYGAASAHDLLHLLAAAGCTIPPLDGADLIVVDHFLPGLSGLDFIRRMRSARSPIPFLLMTALDTRELVQEARRLRVTLLVKPFSLADLSDAARLLLPASAYSHYAEPSPVAL
jgi:two-component system, OmpR family, response regulator RegX3